jgi:hypothetical protein
MLRLVEVITASATNRCLPLYELAWLANVDASERTIRRALHTMEYHRCVAVLRPFLSETAIAKRLAWAYTYAHITKSDWARVIWTDESAMQCGGSIRQYVSHTTKEAMHNDCLTARFKKLSYCLLWGAITSYGKGPLVFGKRRNREISPGIPTMPISFLSSTSSGLICASA